MNEKFYTKNRTVLLFGMFICIGVALFMMVSLISYNPTDSSWWYVSSQPGVIHNYGGFWGAQCAAFLFCFFGGASFLLALPLLLIGLMLMTGASIKNHWERLVGACYLVFIAAISLATYAVDLLQSPYPGGLIGFYGAQKLLYYFDSFGRLLFIYISVCASAVLLFRWSGMFMVQYCIAAVYSSYAMLKKYRVINKIGHAMSFCAYGLLVRLPIDIFKFIKSLCDGTAFHDTGLMHPEEDHEFDFDFIMREKQSTQHYGYVMALLPKKVPYETNSLCISYITLTVPDMRNKKAPEQKNNQDVLLNEAFIMEKKTGSRVTKTVSRYALPRMDIFVAEKYAHENHDVERELHERAQVLQDKLKRFGVNGQVTAIKRGPVVTLFEYQPDVDTKLSKIVVLEDDLAMALQAMSIRIIAPIPGRSVVGFEVSNTIRHDVLFSHIISNSAYTQFSGSLPLVLGKGTAGEAVVVDLARMPHLLIAGSTGSGKSVALNAILISLLCKMSPDDLKLILIDPKRLEFAAFTDIAHLLFPIVTSPHQAAPVLRWVVQEMEERYEKMAKCSARNIGDYNARVTSRDMTDDEQKRLPFIVVVIDELADLMITAGRDIEDLITRITQMARAAGIHMIVATQRPSVDVITGLIKANFPSRISFRVASRVDSRTILDTMGADRLLGRGDMLFIDASTSQLRRVHGAYVSDQEIEEVADHIRKQQKVEYLDVHKVMSAYGQDLSATDDALYKDVREFLDEIDEISISLLQRKFRIGYNRSARLIDLLESQGLIMPQDGSKTRKVIR